MAIIAVQPLVLLLVPIMIGVASTFFCCLHDHRALCRKAIARHGPAHH